MDTLAGPCNWEIVSIVGVGMTVLSVLMHFYTHIIIIIFLQKKPLTVTPFWVDVFG